MRYSEIIEATASLRRPAGTKPPLDPTQASREAERKRRVQRQMRDEQMRHTSKAADLRDRLNDTP